ncbi:MAG: hypothetical protein K6B14_00860 [Lachnospiraceae bacterium]|nr:hypothetical protein [Lachnospiraceae bacterium]
MYSRSIKSTITYCEKPIMTTLAEWLNAHIGRISVGRKNKDGYEILAYSDENSDSKELRQYAHSQKATYITSMDTEGVTAID